MESTSKHPSLKIHLPENKKEYFPITVVQSVHANWVPVSFEQHPEHCPYIPDEEGQGIHLFLYMV